MIVNDAGSGTGATLALPQVGQTNPVRDLSGPAPKKKFTAEIAVVPVTPDSASVKVAIASTFGLWTLMLVLPSG